MAASMVSGNQTSVAIAAAFPREPVRAVAEVPLSSSYKWRAVAYTEVRVKSA